MSAKQLRSERLATGVAGVAAAFSALSQTSSPRVSLVGQISRPDPFQDKSLYFPDDLQTIDHWIEFTAKETQGQALPAINNIANGLGFGGDLLKGASEIIGGTIRLPMPSNVSTDYNPQYSSADLGAAVGQVLKPFDQAIYNNSSMPGLLQGSGSAGILGGGALEGAVSGAIGAGAGFALDKFAGSDAAKAGLKVGAGVATNPHKIVLFTGVDFREHRFSWKLSPRSRDESNRIRDIIAAFTRYSHPEFVGGGLFFKYPEFFEIKFRHPEYLFNLQPSVCTDIQVNYHSQGVAAYIRNADGSGAPAPAEIELTLSFKETEIVTKNYLDGKVNDNRYNKPEVSQEQMDKINKDLGIKSVDSVGPIPMKDGYPLYAGGA
jgi:hypothetical protein